MKTKNPFGDSLSVEKNVAIHPLPPLAGDNASELAIGRKKIIAEHFKLTLNLRLVEKSNEKN